MANRHQEEDQASTQGQAPDRNRRPSGCGVTPPDLHRRAAAGNPASQMGACRFRTRVAPAAGFKDRQETIVLNAPALAVLNGLSRVGEYVIAGDSVGKSIQRPRADLKRPWVVVTRQAGLEGLRLHDLRHNFAAFGAGGGMGLPIIGKLLGHSQPQTTARYAHLDADPLRRASNSIGATIAAAMGEPGESGTITRLKSGKRI